MEPTLFPDEPDNVVDITEARHQPDREPARVRWEDDEECLTDWRTGSAIAHIVHQVRPGWPTVEVMAALEACRDMNPGMVAIGAVQAAMDPRVVRPSRIPQAGPHWPRLAGETVAQMQAVTEIARSRGFDPSTFHSHSTGFLTARCRSYLTQCKDQGIEPDRETLEKFKARKVDVEAIVADVYQQ